MKGLTQVFVINALRVDDSDKVLQAVEVVGAWGVYRGAL